METVGFLMLSHRLEPAELARQARIMVDAGAQCVYVVDSAGALVLSGAQARVQALIDEIGPQAPGRLPRPPEPVAGRRELRPGLPDRRAADRRRAVRARRGGGQRADRGARGHLRPAGGQDRGGRAGVLAAADEVVTPFIPRLPWMDRASIVQGYAGVYSSFLLHAERAAERYGVPAHAILQRVGEAGYVGGQEDMIIDIALTLQQERETADRRDVMSDSDWTVGRAATALLAAEDARADREPLTAGWPGLDARHRVRGAGRDAAPPARPRRAAGRGEARADQPGQAAADERVRPAHRVADRRDGAARGRAGAAGPAHPSARRTGDRVRHARAAGRPGRHRGDRAGRGRRRVRRRRGHRQPVPGLPVHAGRRGGRQRVARAAS